MKGICKRYVRFYTRIKNSRNSFVLHDLQDVMDIITPVKRSWIMSRIRSTDTKPEMKVRKFLWKEGFHYRLHVHKLPGSPDIVLPRYKTAIEVRGCFWHHHHGCKLAHTPTSHTEFWTTKFKRNMDRDKNTATALRSLGWHLIVIWECQLKQKRTLDNLPDRIRNQ